MKPLVQVCCKFIFIVVLMLVSSMNARAQVTAIAPERHPNLFFNTEEILALRQAILQDRSPAYAVSTYESIRNVGPAHKPGNLNSLPWPQNYNAGRLATHINMKANFSYMLEPSQAKAQALRSALLSWTSDPNRGWSHDVQSAGLPLVTKPGLTAPATVRIERVPTENPMKTGGN
ncbi:hypothetical protein SAMN02745866_00902 [Alteromonadaceae bacterium Bs31]|nr:hypothetical protein SAMN02745866_00902 [Alteromonadaceae bacterium Bs31]